MGIIYCLTSPSGKKYIGQTTRDLDKRFEEHCNRKECAFLYNAIQKYGKENIQKEILINCENDLLDFHEIEFIKKFETLYSNGYNIRTGGSSGLHCDASKEKMRQSKLGEKNFDFGKPRSVEAKKNISMSKKGEKHHFFGKELSFEHKLALSKSHKKDCDLPMYLVKLKKRVETNHPHLPTKYFTSKKLTDIEKHDLAFKYLNSYKKN